MNNTKALIAILTILLIILFILSGLLISKSVHSDTQLASSDSTTATSTTEDISVNNPVEDNVTLPLTEDAGWEYIDKIYFVGDSTTYHFHKGGIDKSHIFVPESLTLMLTSSINTVTVGSNGLTISEAIAEAECEYVIITIGVNGADSFTETKYKTYYNKLIDEIQVSSPNTKIILQSVFPVTKAYSDRNIGITNSGIDRLNEWAKDIASEQGIKYLDTQSILKDENGAQLEHYSEQDGVHMNADAYSTIIEYINTHALK